MAEAARAPFQGLKPEQAFRFIKKTLHQKDVHQKDLGRSVATAAATP
jgi:hypothetical protein